MKIKAILWGRSELLQVAVMKREEKESDYERTDKSIVL